MPQMSACDAQRTCGCGRQGGEASIGPGAVKPPSRPTGTRELLLLPPTRHSPPSHRDAAMAS